MSVTAVNIASAKLTFVRQELDFDVWDLAGAKFAIFNRACVSDSRIQFDLNEYTIVVLSPMTAKNGVNLTGRSIIVLDEIETKSGQISFNAFKKYIRIDRKFERSPYSVPPKRKVKAEDAIRIFNPLEENIKSINDNFEKGIKNRNGNDLLLGIFQVVKMAIVHSDDDFDERADPMQVVCDYLGIHIKV